MNDSGDRQIPALLYFKPEQLRTGCHITPLILYRDIFKLFKFFGKEIG